MTTTSYSLLFASIFSNFSLSTASVSLRPDYQAALSSAKLVDSHEGNAHHSQADDNNLLPLVRRSWILGTFFFWVVAIDWHLPGLHARGGVGPRHSRLCVRKYECSKNVAVINYDVGQ